MTIEVITPPKDDEQLIEAAKEILIAASELGMNIHIEGFLMAWASGTKLVVQRDNSDKIISVGIISAGHRWTTNTVTAHVLDMAGNKEALIDYFIKMCKIMDATSLFYQEAEPLEESSEYNRYIVREIKVS